MSEWTAESWVTFFTAAGVFIAGITTAVIKILGALRGIKEEITHQTAQVNNNAERLTETIRTTGTGDGGTP